MKWILTLMLGCSALVSNDDLSAFLDAYKSSDTDLTCKIGRRLFNAGMDDKNVLISIGEACAQADYINFLAYLQQRLPQDRESRKAAVYFSSLLLQKRLIFQFMYENTDLSYYSLPLTGHLLSKVFEAIKNGEYRTLSENPRHIQIGNKDEFLDLYIDKKLYIDHYKDQIKIQQHRYR